MFVVGAVRLWQGRGEVSPAVRGASVVYLAFVGVVFNTLTSAPTSAACSPG